MTKERVSELDQLVSGAIADCEALGDFVENSTMEFWRGAKMIVDELKWEGPVFNVSAIKKQGTNLLVHAIMDYLDEQKALELGEEENS